MDLRKEIKKLVEQKDRVVGILTFEPISPDNLKCGDHIFVYRVLATYTHHGIYVGEGSVIHFTKTEPVIGGTGTPCRVCKYNPHIHRGVVKTCLNCFINPDSHLSGKHIHKYEYGTAHLANAITFAGCSNPLEAARTPSEVVKAAQHLLEKPEEFGKYDLIYNNCEDFAVFCKTGKRLSMQRERQWPKSIIQNYVKFLTQIGQEMVNDN